MKILLMMMLVSCAVSKTKLSDDGKRVKVLGSKNNPDCQVLDKVIGENEKGLDALAQNHARNLAGDMGGDAVWFEEIVSNGNMVKAYAVVYQCKSDD